MGNAGRGVATDFLRRRLPFNASFPAASFGAALRARPGSWRSGYPGMTCGLTFPDVTREIDRSAIHDGRN